MATTKKASAAQTSARTPSKRSGAKTKSAPKDTARSRSGGKSAAASRKSAGAKPAASAKQAASRSSKPAARSNGASRGIISSVVDKVAGIFEATPPSATDLLKADHEKVSILFDKVKANEDGSNVATFKKIKAELDTHTHIEEKIFYPYLLEKGDKKLKDMTREALEEHGQAKQVLAELAKISRDTPTFKAKLKVLMEDIEHHVKEEEDEMFPAVEDRFNEATLATLARELETEKANFRKQTGAGTRAKSQAAR